MFNYKSESKKRVYRFLTIFLILLISLGAFLTIRNTPFASPERPQTSESSNPLYMYDEDGEIIILEGGHKVLEDSEKEYVQKPKEIEPKKQAQETKKPDSIKENDKKPNESSKKPNKDDPTENKNPDKGKPSGNKDPQVATSEPVDIKKPTQDEKETTQPGETGKSPEYFRTGILHNHEYTVPVLDFQIEHLIPELKVKEEKVTLNSQHISPFEGFVKLKPGQNEIDVFVEYEDNTGKRIPVTKHYVVYFVPGEVVINTDLQDSHVTKSDFSFSASAEFKGKPVALEVFHNGDIISGENDYILQLVSGDNEVVLLAKHPLGGEDVKKTYSLYYEKIVDKLRIETDLKDHQAKEPDYTFKVKVFSGEKEVDHQVFLNNKLVDGDSPYQVKLAKGTNTIVVKSSYETESLEETYKIEFNPGTGEDEPNTEAPTIILFSNAEYTVRKPTVNLDAAAKDAKGKWVTDLKLQLHTPGGSYKLNWKNADRTSFFVNLVEGLNEIDVVATDKDGNVATKRVKITFKPASDDDIVGTLTVSVSARNLCFQSFIIPPINVPFTKKDTGATILTKLLKQKGFDYDNTGTIKANFYLASIQKSNGGSFPTAHIDPNIYDWLKKKQPDLDDRVAEWNESKWSLGEFDFTQGSGWMYAVNGTYPNYGFSDYYPRDGDVMELRFTLWYGADIGGGMPGSE